MGHKKHKGLIKPVKSSIASLQENRITIVSILIRVLLATPFVFCAGALLTFFDVPSGKYLNQLAYCILIGSIALSGTLERKNLLLLVVSILLFIDSINKFLFYLPLHPKAVFFFSSTLAELILASYLIFKRKYFSKNRLNIFGGVLGLLVLTALVTRTFPTEKVFLISQVIELSILVIYVVLIYRLTKVGFKSYTLFFTMIFCIRLMGFLNIHYWIKYI